MIHLIIYGYLSISLIVGFCIFVYMLVKQKKACFFAIWGVGLFWPVAVIIYLTSGISLKELLR